MTNTEILNAPESLLSAVDKQRRFILRMQGLRMPCPNCGHKLNVFEATGVSIDDYDTNAVKEGNTHCTSCKRQLRYTVPVINIGGPWHWSLVRLTAV